MSERVEALRRKWRTDTNPLTPHWTCYRCGEHWGGYNEHPDSGSVEVNAHVSMMSGGNLRRPCPHRGGSPRCEDGSMAGFAADHRNLIFSVQ